ncbi:MAG: hypothetical protein IT384_34260 [Deltaproteobacteria bacterium]|nr:hypothetical protein [Deltaproteobacteria bacterium]
MATQVTGLRVEWRASDERCPGVNFVEREIARLVGPAAASTALALEVDVQAPKGRESWRARLHIVAARGEEVRAIAGDSCASLAQASAVIAAMMLGGDVAHDEADVPSLPRVESASPAGAVVAAPSRPARATVETPTRVPPAPSASPSTALSASPSTAPSASPSPAPSASPAATPPISDPPISTSASPALVEPPDPGAPVRFALRVDVLGDAGALPRMTAGLALTGALRIDAALPLRLELGAGAWLSQREIVRGDPAAGGEFGLLAAQARACVEPGSSAVWAFSFCGGAELGFLAAQGFGVSRPQSSHTVVPSVLADVRVSLAISRWLALVGRLEGAAPLARPMFSLDPLGEVHRAAPITARGAIGLELLLF